MVTPANLSRATTRQKMRKKTKIQTRSVGLLGHNSSARYQMGHFCGKRPCGCMLFQRSHLKGVIPNSPTVGFKRLYCLKQIAFKQLQFDHCRQVQRHCSAGECLLPAIIRPNVHSAAQGYSVQSPSSASSKPAATYAMESQLVSDLCAALRISHAVQQRHSSRRRLLHGLLWHRRPQSCNCEPRQRCLTMAVL